MSTISQALINEVLPLLFQQRAPEAVKLLEAHAGAEVTPQYLGLLRLAILRPREPLLYYLRLNNLWQRLGSPALKPNPARRSLVLLCDYTTDGLRPLLSLFAAALGVELEVEAAPFDSVEQLALGSRSPLAMSSASIVLVSLSEHWLARYLGTAALVAREQVDETLHLLQKIIEGLQTRGPAHILLTNFPGRAYAQPGGSAALGPWLGWNRALARWNHLLAEQAHGNVHLVDLADALFAAGGRAAAGRVSYLRGKMVFESAGTIAAAREIATAVGHVCGKTHRALVTDWDNTLWGGEVAETGSHGVVCGLDDPDALGYHRLQQFLKGLTSLGILLAGASRNDLQVQRVFEENPNLPLRADDFASLQVGWTPKSESVARIAQDLGFGAEFMVFLDDSLFELTEVLSAHPYADVVRAGPDAEATLRALTEIRLFNSVTLSPEDLGRGKAAQGLKRQRDLRASFQSSDDFLQSIAIKLEVAPLNDQNAPRVAQLFQKSNQFNLTTRRHGEGDLRRLQDQGGRVGVFSYEDAFGFQGIISVVNLVSDEDALRIESWLMSCRVLNRTVEQAVFSWVVNQAEGRPVLGEYIPTEKNGLVSSLYRQLGFQMVARDAASKLEVWRFDPGVSFSGTCRHYVQIREAA